MTDDAHVGVLETLKSTPLAVRYLLGGMLVNQLGAFVQTFLVLYLTHRHLSVDDAGLSLVAYSAGTVLGTMLGGEATSRFGPRATIVMAMAGSGPLVAVIPALSRSSLLAPLLVVVALAGLLAQAYRPAASVLLSDLMPERQQVMGFSMMRIAINTGAALAPLIAAGLILADWDALFWLDGATTLLWALLAFALLPRHAGPAEAATATGQAEQTPAEDESAKEDGEDTPEPAELTGRAAYAAMLRDRKYVFYLLAVLLGTITYVQSMIALPLQVRADDYPTGLYSAVLTVSSVVLITCELKVTTYILRIPTHTAVVIGHLVNSAGFAVYALVAHSPAFFLIGAVLEVGGLMIAGPSMFAHPATFPAALKARYIGTMQAMAGLASAVGPLFAVFVWTRLDHGFWVLCAAVNAVAGLLAMAGLNRGARPRDPEQKIAPGGGGQGEPEVVGGTA